MFVCDVCGKRYENKPDYCDCGNDVFHEIIPIEQEVPEEPNSTDMGIDIKMVLLAVLIGIVFLTFVFLFSSSKDPKNTDSKNIANQQKTIVNETPKNIKTDTPVKNTSAENVAPKQQQTEQKAVPQQNTSVKKQSATSQTKTAATSKSKAKTQNTTKNTTKTVTKTTPAPVKKTVSTQTSTAAKPKTQTQTQTQSKPAASASTTAATTVKPAATPAKPTFSEEMYNYKITLRQALFSKLSVVSVQGSGTCGIQFSIDSTGKLINRGFTFQSDNKSVNDEVYKMLMRLPKFYPPPADYKGEKIKMIFKFNNGAYSVNYAN